MERIETIAVWDGETEREIGLYLGDLVELSPADDVDLLVASAFPDDYVPMSTSLIGGLAGAGLSVGELAADKAVDLRWSNGFWLSQELEGRSRWQGARQLAVFEPLSLGSPPETVSALFRGLFPSLSDEADQRIAMPILAAGHQGWSPYVMFDSLLGAAVQWMRRGLSLSELMIVERSPHRIAALQGMMQELQAALDSPRAPESTPSSTHDVFLSFSSANADAADSFKRELAMAAPGTTVFDFRISIDKGRPYQTEIDRAIAGCRKVVSILSPAYFASVECQEELNIARLRNKRNEWKILLPVYWRSVQPELPLWLQTLNQEVCVERQFGLLRGAAQRLAASLSGP